MADTKLSALTAKAIPVAADIVHILDSAASNVDKRTTVGALLAGASGWLAATVQAYGVDPTGATNNATELQAALDAAAGKVLLIPPGSYRVQTGLNVSTGTRILARGAKFLNYISGHDNTTFRPVLKFTSVTDIYVEGLEIDGRRATIYPGDVTVEHNHGFSLNATARIKFEDCYAHDCQGDGWCLDDQVAGTNLDISLLRCRADLNARIGFTVTTGDNVHYLACTARTNGFNSLGPNMGFEIEPDGNTVVVRNINYVDCVAEGNDQNGFGATLSSGAAAGVQEGLHFTNCRFLKNGVGTNMSGGAGANAAPQWAINQFGKNVTVEACRFEGGPGPTRMISIGKGCQDVSFRDSYIYNGDVQAFYINTNASDPILNVQLHNVVARGNGQAGAAAAFEVAGSGTLTGLTLARCVFTGGGVTHNVSGYKESATATITKVTLRDNDFSGNTGTATVNNDTATRLFSHNSGTGLTDYPAAGVAITVQDEGTPLATAADTINFVGTGVTATGAAGTKTVTVNTSPSLGLLSVPFYQDGNAAQTLTNIPAALTEVTADRLRRPQNLANVTDARVIVYQGAVSNSGSAIRAQYTTDLTGATGWTYLDASAGPTVALSTSGTLWIYGSWVAVDAGAKTDVLLRPVSISGDGAADPTFWHIAVQFR